MLSLPLPVKIYASVEPVDCRKSFDGLTAAVETVFQRNVLDGHLFLFLNRKRDRLKILWWDRDGKAIFAKRLERGSYELPRHEPGVKQLQLDARQLAMLLEGVPLDAPQRKRFVLPQSKAG